MMVSAQLDEIVHRALMEDVSSGDLTTEAVVTGDVTARGEAIAQTPMVACGADVFARVFYAVHGGVRVERLVDEGSWVEPGAVLWRVEGPAWALLVGERTAHNFAQSMCGIASLTRRHPEAPPEGSSTAPDDARQAA